MSDPEVKADPIEAKESPLWYIECGEHGEQTAEPGSVKRWSEEIEAMFREMGRLKEGETYQTGDCPVCHSTRTAYVHIEKHPISEHTGPS